MTLRRNPLEGGLIVAIDGGAATGKSTTARLVAERLGYRYLDTGAMYRAITWAVLDRGVSLDRSDLINRVAEDVKLEITYSNGGMRISVNGLDVTDAIRSPEVSRHTGRVSEIPEVRALLIPAQREAASDGRIVVEGRDIGTVVLPEADVKLYFTASIEERTLRRLRELSLLGVKATTDEVRRSLWERDERDTARTTSPLYKAEGAIEIDTTNLTLEEQVTLVVDQILSMEAEKRKEMMDGELVNAG